MSFRFQADYNIYAEQLFPLRHGYALWHPEGSDKSDLEGGGPIIGDVGFLNEGSFIRFFNATLDVGHDTHIKLGVPDDHKPLEIETGQPSESIGSHLCSDTVRSFDLDGTPTTGVATSTPRERPAQPVGAGMQFHCSEEHGAFVFTNAPAVRRQMVASCSTSLIRHIRDNIDRWHEWAVERDLLIAKDDLVLISGVTKAEDWGLGAFHRVDGGELRPAEVAYEASTPISKGAFKYYSGGGVQVRTKPEPRPDDTSSAPQAAATSECGSEDRPCGRRGGGGVSTSQAKRDQTLFFHYYKLKDRRWKTKQQQRGSGGALDAEDTTAEEGDGTCGDDGLLDPDGSDGEDFEIEQDEIEKAYDPVDILLEYILGYPMEGGKEVPVAIASDLHIYAVFGGRVPLDIREGLRKLHPPVVTVFVDDTLEVTCLSVAQWAEKSCPEEITQVAS